MYKYIIKTHILVHTAYDYYAAMKIANCCYIQEVNLTKVTVNKGSEIEKSIYCMISFRESLKGKTDLWH